MLIRAGNSNAQLRAALSDDVRINIAIYSDNYIIPAYIYYLFLPSGNDRTCSSPTRIEYPLQPLLQVVVDVSLLSL